MEQVKTEQVEEYADEEFLDFARDVVSRGLEGDVLLIPRDAARTILTQKRIEIVETLREEDFESMRGLARELERDIKSVSRDLDVLWEHDIIEYRREGGRKIPELEHDRIIVEPL
ncbi:MAG: transcriptional regulator [Candidatus Nanohaloarchaea archaeon]|nr:transcriptional regulator [Candidatus Nanohaloarchaea archaeon]